MTLTTFHEKSFYLLRKYHFIINYARFTDSNHSDQASEATLNTKRLVGVTLEVKPTRKEFLNLRWRIRDFPTGEGKGNKSKLLDNF